MSDNQHAKAGITASHWGIGKALVINGKLQPVSSPHEDPSPSRINENIASSLSGRARVLRPAIRKGWLENGPGPARSSKRGRDDFVEVSWDEALDHLAKALKETRSTYGNKSIFAGSYGWASAGRFHHAQSQLKRFLNAHGGFLASKGNYSYNAALILLPHIVGNYREHVSKATRFTTIAKHGELVVMFGGIPLRNTQVSDGGIQSHRVPTALQACAKAGVRFVNFSSLKTDADAALSAEWLAPKPGSDTAVMMGLAHVLLTENLYDHAFVEQYCVGFPQVAAYLKGATDGIAKDVDWASQHSGIPAEKLRDLAREMAAKRTMICTAAALQRADFGEQPLWMTVTLAAMLGQIGLPGGGYTIGYGVNGVVGAMNRPLQPGSFTQGVNPISDFIPVAMTTEMLINPGQAYEYNGENRVLPEARMVWWAGGNPFHHHQDLNQLHEAFQRPDTIVVNEINWTSTARHEDIVLPVAAPEERRDFCIGNQDNAFIPSPALVAPAGEAMTEYALYCALEARMGEGNGFSKGRSEEAWLERMWAQTQQRAATLGHELPDWETFMKGGVLELADPAPEQVFLADFRTDPEAHKLPTPSGRIELVSNVIAGFGYEDCPKQATWFAPRRATGDYPLALI